MIGVKNRIAIEYVYVIYYEKSEIIFKITLIPLIFDAYLSGVCRILRQSSSSRTRPVMFDIPLMEFLMISFAIAPF